MPFQPREGVRHRCKVPENLLMDTTVVSRLAHFQQTYMKVFRVMKNLSRWSSGAFCRNPSHILGEQFLSSECNLLTGQNQFLSIVCKWAHGLKKREYRYTKDPGKQKEERYLDEKQRRCISQTVPEIQGNGLYTESSVNPSFWIQVSRFQRKKYEVSKSKC